MTRPDSLLTEQKGSVLIITLNRPERLNAWDMAMRKRLRAILKEADGDADIHAVVITGTGDRAFSAGQDLNEASDFDEDRAVEWIEEFGELYGTLRSLEIPVVAAINGIAAGSAFQFALLTDIRVGHPGVKMGQPEINSGIASITGPWIMREMIGMSRTIELTLTGRLMEADEALAIGVLHHIVPAREVLPFSLQLASQLASKPPHAMRLIKRRLFEVIEPGLNEAIEAAKRLHRESFAAGEPQATASKFLASRGGKKNG